MSSLKLDRCIWLIDTIRRRGKIDYEQLNRLWQDSYLNDAGEELSKRTLKRHIDTAEDFFGVCIRCDCRNGYSYFIDESESQKTNDLSQWLIDSYSTMNQLNADKSLQGRIIFENIPSGSRWLTTITEAMRENRVLKITYQSFWRGEPNTFTIEPYFLKVVNRRWYVIARSPYYSEMNERRGIEPADVFRNYSLDRIHEVEATDETFVMKKEFSAEEYFNGCIGIIRSDEPCQRIVIKAFGKKADYLRTLPLHESQKEITGDDQSATFEYLLRPNLEFYQAALAMADQAEILEPASVREVMGYYANELNFRYNGKGGAR
ncbi:MAG: WYL domain-containing protein [Bacteroidales bacterium]|nr:WYL domain-containing protein [Bacteroidales bacterium]